jgi:hypothetical protein
MSSLPLSCMWDLLWSYWYTLWTCVLPRFHLLIVDLITQSWSDDWALTGPSNRADIIADTWSTRSGFILFGRAVIWPWKFSISHAPNCLACVACAEVTQTHSWCRKCVVYLVTSMYVIMFAKWNCARKCLPTIRGNARPCTSNVTPILDSKLLSQKNKFCVCCKVTWVVASTTQTKLPERCTQHVLTAPYTNQYCSQKYEFT